jgi:hypothetical protein
MLRICHPSCVVVVMYAPVNTKPTNPYASAGDAPCGTGRARPVPAWTAGYESGDSRRRPMARLEVSVLSQSPRQNRIRKRLRKQTAGQNCRLDIHDAHLRTRGDMLRAAARVASPRAPCCTGGRPGAKNRDARRGSELRGWRVVPKRDSKYLVAEEGPRKGAPAFSATGEEARAVQRGSDESAFAEENMENNASTSKPPDAALATLVAYCGQEDGVSSGADAHRALRDLPCPKISTVDKHFLEKLGVNFRWGLRDDANLDELNDLFNSVGFPRRDTTRLRRALVNSRLLIWIVVANKKNKSSGVFVGQVIGTFSHPPRSASAIAHTRPAKGLLRPEGRIPSDCLLTLWSTVYPFQSLIPIPHTHGRETDTFGFYISRLRAVHLGRRVQRDDMGRRGVSEVAGLRLG